MLDYGLLNSMQEQVNPGYLKRMEQNMKKSHGQEYFDFARPSRHRFLKDIE
jgi:hypothetical protein